jgi:hypothetical protein
MGSGVKTVVKLIAPVAIQALAQASEQLLAGQVYTERRAWLANYRLGLAGRNRRAPPHPMRLADDDPGTTISENTWQYCEANFATSFGYYYQGLTSQPTTGDMPTAAGEDIIVWQTSHNGLGDLKAYLQIAFKDTLPGPDSIELSKNLSDLFEERFKESSLDWTPFLKRYNQLPSKTIVDCYMVTSPTTDSDGNPAGIASFCWVAYDHGK